MTKNKYKLFWKAQCNFTKYSASSLSWNIIDIIIWRNKSCACMICEVSFEVDEVLTYLLACVIAILSRRTWSCLFSSRICFLDMTFSQSHRADNTPHRRRSWVTVIRRVEESRNRRYLYRKHHAVVQTPSQEDFTEASLSDCFQKLEVAGVGFVAAKEFLQCKSLLI